MSPRAGAPRLRGDASKASARSRRRTVLCDPLLLEEAAA
jgi:hypothetical protein